MTAEESFRLAAYHEAGHAVAAMMRGGGDLRATPIVRRDGSGLTLTRVKDGTGDGHFMSYAGPWAEARLLTEECERAGHHECDGGAVECFSDWLVCVFIQQSHSDPGSEYAADWQALQRPHPNPAMAAFLASEHGDGRGLWWEGDTEQVWRMELGRAWPAIAQVAELLIAGEEVTGATIEALLGAVLTPTPDTNGA